MVEVVVGMLVGLGLCVAITVVYGAFLYCLSRFTDNRYQSF